MIIDLLITLIIIHWAFTVGSIIAQKTNYTIPRFIIICILLKYLTISYGY